MSQVLRKTAPPMATMATIAIRISAILVMCGLRYSGCGGGAGQGLVRPRVLDFLYGGIWVAYRLRPSLSTAATEKL